MKIYQPSPLPAITLTDAYRVAFSVTLYQLERIGDLLGGMPELDDDAVGWHLVRDLDDVNSHLAAIVERLKECQP